MAEICCICRAPIEMQANGWPYGHNAAPIREGRCCEDCNYQVVVPARVRYIQYEYRRRCEGCS